MILFSPIKRLIQKLYLSPRIFGLNTHYQLHLYWLEHQNMVKKNKEFRTSKKIIIWNQWKPWNRKYKFKLIRQIYDPKSRPNSPPYHIKNIRYLSQSQFQSSSKSIPLKFLPKKPPTVTIPPKLEVTIHSGNVLSYDGKSKFILLPIQEVLNYNGPAKLSVPQMEITQKNMEIPQIVRKSFQSLYRANLWFYLGKRITQWHYDGHDNFLFGLTGYKIVYLAHPQTFKSHPVFSLFNNHFDNKSQRNTQIIGNKTLIYRTVLHPNQCLYIPRGWWHKVISIGKPCIAVNIWGNSLISMLNLGQSDKKMLLKQLLLNFLQQKCREQFQKWDNTDEQIKQKIREKMCGILIKENL